MTTMKVVLPSKDLLISWSHPWIRTRRREIENVLTKISQCFVCEDKGVDEKGKLKVRLMGSSRIKWPLYSMDGTPSKTVNMNGDRLSKGKGRKLSLKKALEGSGLTTAERTIVWHTYLRTFEPGVPVPPTVAVALLASQIIDAEIISRGEHVVVSKEVTPARLIHFPPIISPQSHIVH